MSKRGPSASRPAPTLWTAAKTLPPHEALRCREAFCTLDGGTGVLPLRQLRSVLQRLSIYPSEEDLFALIAAHDPEGTGMLTIDSFVALVADHRQLAHRSVPVDSGAIDAFVALGGNRDQSGVISTDKLREAVRDDFALPIDIDRLIREADADGSGFIDFEEFTSMLK